MAAPNPMPSLPPPPPVSKRTMHMTGLLVDVYGLEELSPSATCTTVVWLHHPRLRAKEDMVDMAARCVSAWNTGADAADLQHEVGDSSPARRRREKRGLIAAAFDQRNHGSRLVAARANEAWRRGNATHAQDMFGAVAGTVADTRLLMDALEAYAFPEGRVRADRHLFLGVSLGGHSGWQLVFAEPRVVAAVLVVGCPDFMSLMCDRARLSRLSTFNGADGGASFLGSRDFPRSLVEACHQLDPRGLVFGGEEPSWPSSEREHRRVRQLLAARLAGKRLLVCSGADDKLVPYRCSEPFMTFLKRAKRDYRELGLELQDNVYPGAGHVFTEDMVKDAIRFIVEAVAPDEGSAASATDGDDTTSKI